MAILFGFILLGLLIGGSMLFYYYSVFKKNKSKVEFDINNNQDNIDWISKHPEIKSIEDEIKIKWYGIAVGDYETHEKIRKLKKLYRNVIIEDIFPKIFKIITNNLVSFTIDDFDAEYEYFEYEEENVSKYENKNKKAIKKIFKETKRKAYARFMYDFDFTCRVENKQVNIIRFINYLENDSSEPNDPSTYVNSFIGYIINIPDFDDLNKLNEIDKKDYYYDKETKTLTLIVSDQVTNKLFRKELNTYFPEDYKKQENGGNIYLNLYNNFYTELYKYICRFI